MTTRHRFPIWQGGLAFCFHMAADHESQCCDLYCHAMVVYNPMTCCCASLVHHSIWGIQFIHALAKSRITRSAPYAFASPRQPQTKSLCITVNFLVTNIDIILPWLCEPTLTQGRLSTASEQQVWATSGCRGSHYDGRHCGFFVVVLFPSTVFCCCRQRQRRRLGCKATSSV